MGSCVKEEWAVGGCGLKATSVNRDSHLASRSVLNDFTDDALTISAGSLFQNVAARTLKAHWRLREQHPVCGTFRRGRVAFCKLDGRRWTPWVNCMGPAGA